MEYFVVFYVWDIIFISLGHRIIHPFHMDSVLLKSIVIHVANCDITTEFSTIYDLIVVIWVE
jgi:hypothetical protein